MDLSTTLAFFPSVFSSPCVAFFLVLLLCVLWEGRGRRRRDNMRLPPGPVPLPVVGNLFQLGSHPHRTLASLAKVHGPLMTLKLGGLTTIVASSADMAREVLQKNDRALSARSVPDAARAFRHHQVSVTWLPVGDQLWRDLRRFYRTRLFTTQRLDATEGLRRRMVEELVEFLRRSGEKGQAVDVGKAVFTATLNLISNTLFSANIADLDAGTAQGFKDLTRGILEEVGGANVADFFPLLRWVDPQGRRRRSEAHFKRLHGIFDAMIARRRSELREEGGTRSPDLLATLLEDEGNHKLDERTMKALFADSFVGGSETSASTVEWTMAELLRNPEVMARAQAELDGVVTADGRRVEESDIPRLPYLRAVVKEALRLHPPAPLLIPHLAETSVELAGGYTVPKRARVLVNMWAIGRDAGRWAQPESFSPERFLVAEEEVDFRGHDFELIPFGSGRRVCPGMPLAFRMVHLALARLLQSFRWRLPDGMAPKDVDLTERFGLSLCPATPVRAVPAPRSGWQQPAAL